MPSVLMLCPGLMCDAVVWAPQVQALSATRTCVVVDYGLRDSLADMARHVLATAPAERFAVAGHSMGGRVALEVMRIAPDRVSHLALLDTGIHPLAVGTPGATEKAGRLGLVALAREQGMRTMAQQWLANMVHPTVRGTPLFVAIIDMLVRSNADQLAAQTQALLARPDAAPVLPIIRCPTLLLTGEQDLWSPPEQHAAIARKVADAVLHVVPRCGHMSTLEQPDAVTAALVTWLQREGTTAHKADSV
ncbi:alpha/beta hydrolase [Rhodoferax sp. U2-2l]|uniref:alpha/beta fold hydrolase n=1 Tax=Rhodoferax sp. U2-2l TaxID=2884000 RepID=UPI001D0B6416|nr:alpha/beta fold hydrolase [Rhodoferax sp. U2-2l]MCB8748696.1 alpha/beta hydrolase [Rhodoferax sp. U2-2l]